MGIMEIYAWVHRTLGHCAYKTKTSLTPMSYLRSQFLMLTINTYSSPEHSQKSSVWWYAPL